MIKAFAEQGTGRERFGACPRHVRFVSAGAANEPRVRRPGSRIHDGWSMPAVRPARRSVGGYSKRGTRSESGGRLRRASTPETDITKHYRDALPRLGEGSVNTSGLIFGRRRYIWLNACNPTSRTSHSTVDKAGTVSMGKV